MKHVCLNGNTCVHYLFANTCSLRIFLFLGMPTETPTHLAWLELKFIGARRDATFLCGRSKHSFRMAV